MRRAKSKVDNASRCTASRLVRLDTGSSRLAVLAIHTARSANGNGRRPSRVASDSTTG